MGGNSSTCILFNPNAGPGREDSEAGGAGTGSAEAPNDPTDTSYAGEWKERLGRWVEIPAPGEGGQLAQRLIDEGVERLIVAGGDGTVRDVAEGALRSGRRVSLGVLPMGTGNDFARTLGLPLDGAAAGEVIARAERVLELDAISLTSEAGTWYGVNVASGGFGGEVGHERMPPGVPGFLSYLAGAASHISELTDRRLRFTWEDGSEEELEAIAVVVANGRTAAGGLQVAPNADPEDGLLDVLAVTHAALGDLFRVGVGLLAGDYTDAGAVREWKVEKVRVSSDPPVPFNLDGERVPESKTFDFQIMPRALSWIVGPEYGSPRPR